MKSENIQQKEHLSSHYIIILSFQTHSYIFQIEIWENHLVIVVSCVFLHGSQFVLHPLEALGIESRSRKKEVAGLGPQGLALARYPSQKRQVNLMQGWKGCFHWQRQLSRT